MARYERDPKTGQRKLVDHGTRPGAPMRPRHADGSEVRRDRWPAPGKAPAAASKPQKSKES